MTLPAIVNNEDAELHARCARYLRRSAKVLYGRGSREYRRNMREAREFEATIRAYADWLMAGAPMLHFNPRVKL